jgi:hypothetical protein
VESRGRRLISLQAATPGRTYTSCKGLIVSIQNIDLIQAMIRKTSILLIVAGDAERTAIESYVQQSKFPLNVDVFTPAQIDSELSINDLL